MQRHHLLNDTELNGGTGHAKDNTGVFMFGNGLAARLRDELHAESAVIAHTGHQNSHHMVTGTLGGRSEQHIHSRSAMVNGRCLNQSGPINISFQDDHQVEISRRNQTQPRMEHLVVNRLPDFVVG